MSDNQVDVRIVGDASKVAPAVDTAKAGIAGLGEATAATSAKMRESFAGVSVAVHEMGMQVRETFEAIGGYREMLLGIGEAMIAAFAVEKVAEWTREMGEAAEKTAHLAETFGMTVPQVQGLQSAATMTGMSIDTMSKAMGIFDKNMVNAATGTGHVAEVLKSIGISARQGKDQMELVLEVADKFKDMADGPLKVAAAMALFGKSGKEMIPFLDQGREGIQALDKVSQDYAAGVLIASQANKELRDWLTEVNAKGKELAESTNTTSVAMQGVSNIMTDTFSPILKEITDDLNAMIKAFIESYREGGTVAVIFDAITIPVSALIAVIKDLAEVFGTLWSAASEIVSSVAGLFGDTFGSKLPSNIKSSDAALNTFKDVMVAVKDVVIVCIDAISGAILLLEDQLRMFSKVAWDAMTLNWGSIEGDWRAGLDKIAADAETTANRIKGAMSEAATAMQYAAFGLAMPGSKAPEEPKADKQDYSAPLPAAHEKKEKKPKDDLVQRLEAEIAAEKAAWVEKQNLEGTAIEFSLQREAEFWDSKRALAAAGTKDRGAIDQKWIAAQAAVTKEAISIEIDGYKQQLAEVGKNADAKLAVEQREATEIKRIYGERSTQYAAAMDRVAAATRASTEQRLQIEQNHTKAVEAFGLAAVDQDEANANFRVQKGRETNAQLISEERQFEQARNAIKVGALQADLARMKLDPSRDPVKFAQLNAQIDALEQQHQNKLTQIDQKAAAERSKVQRTAISGLASSWSQSLSQMMTGQMSFTDGIKSLWQGLVSTIAQAFANMLEQWLVQQLTSLILGKTQQGVTGVAMVTSNAAVAASGAYAATAAIPVIGPGLAPEAAATAFSGAMMFAPIASAMGGWDVPSFGGPGVDGRGGQFSIVHPQEMILPASLATPMRSMIQSGPAGAFAAPAANGGGGVQHNYHGPVYTGDINTMDSKSFQRFTLDNRHHIAAAVKSYARDGGR